ncbi:MAG: FAD binding domain-containing protein [Anaerolineales bacterium]
MKPPPFKYIAAESVEHALEQMAEHGDAAKLLAGGQSLIPAMNFRVLQPSVLIDLNRIDDLEYIKRSEDGALVVGAMTRHRDLERSQDVKRIAPLLYEAMPHIAHPQIRNRGTSGGSRAHADPAAELPAVAIAAGASMKATGPNGDRRIEAKDFFQGMFSTALELDEILVEVTFPAKTSQAGSSFEETSRRRGDYAMMGVAAAVEVDDEGACKEARLVYLNAGDGPVEAEEAAAMLRGERPGQEVIAAAAGEAADNEIDPMGNVHASIDFQRHLARVLTERALVKAFARVGNSKG